MRKIIQKKMLLAVMMASPVFLFGCNMMGDGGDTSYRAAEAGYVDANRYYQNNDPIYNDASHAEAAAASAPESKPKSIVQPTTKPAVPLAAPVAQSPSSR